MRGWQYVETCFASLCLLYSFWTSTLVSTTAAGDEICMSKKQIPAESCKLWKESLRHCRAQAGLPGECGLLWMCSISSSYLLVVLLHLLDSDIERDLPYRSTCWLTLLLCLLLPPLILQYASCSPGIPNVKTYSMPGQGESFGLHAEAGSNASRSKGRPSSVSETRKCNLTTRR